MRGFIQHHFFKPEVTNLSILSMINRNGAGFTLVEVLVSFAILSLLFALVIPSYNAFKTNQEVTQAAQTLKTDLRFVQSQATGGVKNTNCTTATTLLGWYIKIEAGAYRILSRCQGVAEIEYKMVRLPPGVTLTVSNNVSPSSALFRTVNQSVATITASGVVSDLSGEAIFTLWKGSKAIDIKVRTTGDIYE